MNQLNDSILSWQRSTRFFINFKRYLISEYFFEKEKENKSFQNYTHVVVPLTTFCRIENTKPKIKYHSK